MLIFFDVKDKREELGTRQDVVCEQCGRYGRYRVYMTYTCLSVFFVPCIKFGREYFAEMTCCGSLYELDPEVGRKIKHGADVKILKRDLWLLHNGRNRVKRCIKCGFETREEFEFCPYCGGRL